MWRTTTIGSFNAKLYSAKKFELRKLAEKMVKLVVATTTDPASMGPAKELLAMPGWQSGPTLDQGIRSYSNDDVRFLEHDKGIVEEDDLDQRWENATGQSVDEVIFLSKHTAVSNLPALTIHPIGMNSILSLSHFI